MKELLVNTYVTLLPIVAGYIIYLLKKQSKKKDANSRGTMVLLQVKLIEYHDKYCASGYIPSYVYKNFCNMYEAYKELGGNDMVTHMKEEIDELQINGKKRMEE